MTKTWYVRKEDDDYHVDIYGMYSELFCVKIHHGGFFTEFPGRVYANGNINYVDLLDRAKFSILELKDIVKEIGFQRSDLYFHYRIPGDDLDTGLRGLETYHDVVGMLKHIEEHNEVEVYIEVGETKIGIALDSASTQHPIVQPEKIKSIDVFGRYFDEVMNPLNVDNPGQTNFVEDDNEENELNDDENQDDNEENEVDQYDHAENQDGNEENENQDDEHDQSDPAKPIKGIPLLLKNESNEAEDGYEPELLDSDSFGSSCSGDENERMVKRNIRKLRKKSALQKCTFYLGQQFADVRDLKNLVRMHAVETKRQLKFAKHKSGKLQAVCEGFIPIDVLNEGPSQKEGGRKTKEKPNKCPWVVYASKVEGRDTWVIKTYNSHHICLQSRSVKFFTSDLMSKELHMQIATNPDVPIKSIQEQMQIKYEMGVSKSKAFRAKASAAKVVMGDYIEQYSKLMDYALELKRTNPGTTVKIDVEIDTNPAADERVFKRIYICLGPLKEGFRACRREFLGLDGAFMKGPFPGQLLTAVGVDPNNGIFPLAYGVVEAECKNSWVWFLTNVMEDLDLHSNYNFTFISDRQKGLIPALTQLMPLAEHRYCLRHIHQNMKLQWRGKAYKDVLWGVATAHTAEGFEIKMNQLKALNDATYQWLKKIPYIHWCRSHFTGRSRCDMLLNNLCEVFNAQLVDGRDKPIITTLEFVREYLMKRYVNVMKAIEKSEGFLTPTITEKFEKIKKEASNLIVKWNTERKYQVTGQWGEQYVVDVVEKVCSCRRWELTGIPCKHAVATNWNMQQHGIQVEIPELWVDRCYWLDTWKEVYSHKIGPINGMSMWPKSTCPTKLVEPRHHIPIGRPRKKRKNDAMEKDDLRTTGKLSRAGKTVKCSKCKKKGHNSRTCRGQGASG